MSEGGSLGVCLRSSMVRDGYRLVAWNQIRLCISGGMRGELK